MTENQNNMTPSFWYAERGIISGYKICFGDNYNEIIETVTANRAKEICQKLNDLFALCSSTQFTAGVEAGKRERKWIPIIHKPASGKKLWVTDGKQSVQGFYIGQNFHCNFNEIQSENITHYQLFEVPSPPNPDKGGKENQ